MHVAQASEAKTAAQRMQDAAASIRKQVEAESAMLDTHASLAKELQAAETAVKVRRIHGDRSCMLRESGLVRPSTIVAPCPSSDVSQSHARCRDLCRKLRKV